MIHTTIFRVVAYSPSTSHVTAAIDRASDLHKFLESREVRVEPMVEATGTILRGYVDDMGTMLFDAEPAVVTFVADATPAMLQPLLQIWFDGLGAASKDKKNEQDGDGNPEEPQRGPAPGAGA